MTEKLVCDRCDIEYTDEASIEIAKRYQETWEVACRSGGIEYRGVAPCPRVDCPGQLILKEEQ